MQLLRGAKRDLLLVCIAVVSLQFAFLGVTSHFYNLHGSSLEARVGSQDASQYIALAHSMLQGTFGSGTTLEEFRTPGYPAFAALVLVISGGTFFSLVLAQIIIAAGIALLGYILARSLNIGRAVSTCIAVLAGASPAMLLATMGAMGVDMLYTLLTLAALVLIFRLERAPRAVALGMGLLLGAAVLVRPIGLYASLPVLFAIPLFIPAALAKRLAAFALACAVFAAAIVPWMWHNYSVAGRFSLSSVATYNIVYYNLPYFLVNKYGTSVDDERAKLLQPLTSTPTDELRNFKYAGALRSIASDTLKKEGFVSYGVFHVERMDSFFLSSSVNVLNAVLTAGISDSVSTSLKPFILAERGGWALLFLLAFASPFLARGRERIFLSLAVVLIFANAFLTSPVSQPRYRLPVEALVFTAAFYCASAIAERLRRQQPLKRVDMTLR
ncbi:MAG: hypothetical protein RLZZ416_520 [Candidatus Parcubacteria bacterium]|jgi:4-amino-4-deoxy-L-arabinose transferase-like glycosyltransferase